MSSVLEIARYYVSQGLSVIPVKADGSKSPAITGWRTYSNKIADEKQLAEWFSGPGLVGIGVVPGPASGNLVVLDFEHAGESAYVEWIQRLPDMPDNLRELANTLPTVSTPTGGRHIWIRLSDPQPGGKLARYANGKTKIEIRGEGHQVLAPGCPAECHATGNLYGWAIQTPIVELDDETWAEFLAVCGQCNEYQAAEQPRDRELVGNPAGVDSPGNDFNRRGTWEETGLFDAGWTWAKDLGGRGFLTRPGKCTGISASVGMVTSRDHGYPYFFAWTTSTDFPPETPFSRFAVYAALKHKGNYSEAAKELSRAGYGERPGMSSTSNGIDLSGFSMKLGAGGVPVHPFAKPGEVAPVVEGEEKPFKWMSELATGTDDQKWIWRGYIPRGGITLFSALWKSGKSTILSHLIKSFDGSVSQFLGLDVVPSRVLYITEEDEKKWSERRDNLLIGDHVGMWCRPFRIRPTMQEWRQFIGLVVGQVDKFKFDLVIFDTLSKMWPVREENDAGQVEEGLMPLWSISTAGAAILLVHHTRKSGGEQFVGARGSGGLSAFTDVLMEFKRETDEQSNCKRIISAVGRSDDIPIKMLCELKNGRYAGLGDPEEGESHTKPDSTEKLWQSQLLAILENATDPMSFEAIREKLPKPPAKAVLLKELNRLFDNGELSRLGDGKSASPYTYELLK